MGKRAVIFLVVSLMIMLVYPFVIEKFLIKGRKIDGKKEEASVRSPEQETKVQELQLATPLSQAIEEKEIIVETDLMRVKLSNIGGVIKRWELKKYTLPDGSRIELLPQGKEGIAPLSIYMEDQQGTRALEGGSFEVSGGDLRLSRDRKTGSIEFSYQDAVTGKKSTKRLTFLSHPQCWRASPSSGLYLLLSPFLLSPDL